MNFAITNSQLDNLMAVALVCGIIVAIVWLVLVIVGRR